MPAPQHTINLLIEQNIEAPGNFFTKCEGSVHHSPTPMFVVSVPTIPSKWSELLSQRCDMVNLCGICRDNLAALQDILLATGGNVPWEVRRKFGNEIRRIGCDSWETYTALV